VACVEAMSGLRRDVGAAIGEGYGAPVHVNDTSRRATDPTLDSCCQREIESNRRYNSVNRTLRLHDRVAIAERLRRNAVQMKSMDGLREQGCRCAFDPNQDGGEYSALRELKVRLADDALEEERERRENITTDREVSAGAANEQKEISTSPSDRGDGSDSDDDSEFDYLLDDLDGPGAAEMAQEMEARRRDELENAFLQRENLVHHGYGVHRQMNPSRVLHFAGLGTELHRGIDDGVVLHLYDPNSTASAHLDYLLESKLSRKYGGTKFLRSSGRPVLLMNQEIIQNSFERLKGVSVKPENDLPALVAIRNGEVVAVCKNLSGLTTTAYNTLEGERNIIVESALEHWLDMAGVLRCETEAPPMEVLCRIRPEEDALIASGILGKDANTAHAALGRLNKDQASQEANLAGLSTAQRAMAELRNRGMKTKEDDLPTFFRCGVPGCEKTYKHEHVGVQTEEQTGLVVKMDFEGNATSVPSL
jgi:hypothetical protein